MPASLFYYGPLVKRLRQRPLTPLTWVRFPHGSPNTDKNEPVIYICEWRVRYCRRPRAGQLKKAPHRRYRRVRGFFYALLFSFVGCAFLVARFLPQDGESVFQRRGHGDAHNAEIFDDTHAVICAEKENDRRARNARRAREQTKP